MSDKMLLNMWKLQDSIVHPDSMCLSAWPKTSSSLKSGEDSMKEVMKVAHSVKITDNVHMVNLNSPLHQQWANSNDNRVVLQPLLYELFLEESIFSTILLLFCTSCLKANKASTPWADTRIPHGKDKKFRNF